MSRPSTWPAGERERLLSWHATLSPRLDPQELARQVRDGTIDEWVAPDLFEDGPEDIVRPLLPVWNPGRLTGVHYWLPRIVARFGVAALPLVLRVARRSPLDGGPHLLPFTAPEVALLAADWHGRLKAARTIALDWLRRHPPPRRGRSSRPRWPGRGPAAGTPGRPCSRWPPPVTAARSSPPPTPTGRPPAPRSATCSTPTRSTCCRPASRPRPSGPTRSSCRRSGCATAPHVLPADAVRHLVTMLMLSKLGDPYAGIAHVRAACEPSDLARFAWALLQRWESADAPPAGSWALDAQAVLGDDETAVMLAAAVRLWPYEGAHKRAATGLDVLAQLGTDAALTPAAGHRREDEGEGGQGAAPS